MHTSYYNMSTTTPLDEFISGMGYETGESRMASESGDSKDKKMNYKNGDGSSITMPIAATKKRKREDSNSSGYDRDLSSDKLTHRSKKRSQRNLSRIHLVDMLITAVIHQWMIKPQSLHLTIADRNFLKTSTLYCLTQITQVSLNGCHTVSTCVVEIELCVLILSFPSSMLLLSS